MKKATMVDLDGEALEVLEESRDQGNLKIINLKDICQFKGKDGIWYITNNEKFGNTPYGISRSLEMGKQIHDFKTGLGDTDDADKKSWWQSIWNWGGDSGYSRDDEDNRHSNNYGNNNPYFYNQINNQNYNQNSGNFWNAS